MDSKIKILIGVLMVGIVFVGWWWIESSRVYPENPEVTITTDKTEYTQREAVKITVVNSLDHIVVLHFPWKFESKRFWGENFGIGAIERFEEKAEVWIPVEPVWRCGNSCFKECRYKHSFEPGEKRVFEWNQTVLICDRVNRTERIEKAAAGRYRVSSNIDIYDKELTTKTIYSNEFTIKERKTEIKGE
ncbi:MAG: hypothetical protein ACE5WD_11210 [Candidatus Aminicenantia bacterium]